MLKIHSLNCTQDQLLKVDSQSAAITMALSASHFPLICFPQTARWSMQVNTNVHAYGDGECVELMLPLLSE